MKLMEIILPVLLLVFAVCLSTCTREEDSRLFRRLPRNLIPSRYELHITPDLSPLHPPFNVKAEVVITFTCHIPTNRLVLNNKGPKFSIQNVKPNFRANVSYLFFDPINEFVYLDFNEDFKEGHIYPISIEYEIIVRNNGFGMYAAPYIDLKGETKYLITTQFEAIGLRQMMPCFDEVDMKAIFEVTITRNKNHFAISNDVIISSKEIGDKVVDTFKPSPVMTPYLLAMVIGDIKFLESPVDDAKKYKTRTSTTERLVNYIQHPNRYYTAPIQDWLEKVTLVPYELEKLDHIALYHKHGAMENWGLITYDESNLLVSNETSTVEGKLRSSSFMAHELAHMWYGNLVTCSWWTHLWVQEGIAFYYNFHPLASLGWDGDSLQQSQTIQSHMLADQTINTTPVRIQINSPQEAMMSFSDSTYEKGAAVLRMVEQILSKPLFEKALTEFLHRFDHSSAHSDDLLKVFTEQAEESDIKQPDGSPIDFKVFLDPWLDQKGFPLIKVVKSAGTATITQSRYFSPRGQSEIQTSQQNNKWDVPINIVDASTQTPYPNKAPDHWLKIDQEILSIEIAEENDYWFIINPDQKYFYRVFYDDDLRKHHSDNLMKLSAASRAQIIDDSFSLARNAYYTVETAMDNSVWLGEEKYQASWAATLRHLAEIEGFFRSQKWYFSFKAHFSEQASKMMDVIGDIFKLEEPIELQMLRKGLYGLLVSYGERKYFDDALKKFTTYTNNPTSNPINANKLAVVACAGVRETSQVEFDIVKTEYDRRRLTPITEERRTLAYAMTCSTRPNDLTFIFDDLTLHGVFFEAADVSVTADYLAATPYGEKLLWKYMEENWDKRMKFSKEKTMRVITNKFYTSQHLKKLEEFMEGITLKSSDKIFFSERVLRVKQNIQFHNENVEVLNKWLGKQNNQSSDLLASLQDGALSTLFPFGMFADTHVRKRSLSQKQILKGD